MPSFAAIDFETANYTRSSVCSIGVVIVREGEIVDTFYSLIKPTPNYYNDACVAVHGLTKIDTNSADTFDVVWAEIEPMLEGLPFVAHNKSFDAGCLKAAHEAYGMYYPDYDWHCTLQTARKKLNLENNRLPTVAHHFGIDFTNHHNAIADAEACAKIAIALEMEF